MTRSTKVGEYYSDALNLIEAIHAGDLRTAAGIVMLYAQFDGAIDPENDDGDDLGPTGGLASLDLATALATFAVSLLREIDHIDPQKAENALTALRQQQIDLLNGAGWLSEALDEGDQQEDDDG
jgi:hypothetical protein